VAALGHAYGPNAERGIFRSLDGGKTWDKVLYKDDKTGAIDVVFDPQNPNTLFAALWQVYRTPWSLVSGGEGSGLYRSTDGGTTWKHLEGEGLPKGIMGRIGVSVSGADSNRVYALIEAKEGGLYRSDDGGDHWKMVNNDGRFRQRAWYFTNVYADPKSVDTVYILNTGAFRSTDGGATFNLLPAPHGDHHALWIDPTNPDRMINGNDGGATISIDGGKTWTAQGNQPTAQFYHVITDNAFPYHLYGSQQDNTSVCIASRTDEGTITTRDWYDVGGGESGYIAPSPVDSNLVYADDEGLNITKFDKRTEQVQDISPWPLDTSGQGAANLLHRLQWTEPIIVSPHDPNVIYTTAEVVFKSTNGGQSWDIISPDLTRNDKAKQQPSGGPLTLDITSVEYYDTIFALAESPVQKGELWAGSDDGLIHVTTDDGKNWTNVTPKAIPEWSMISIIDPSPFDANTAFVAVDRHKLDDLTPYIFETTDMGKSWKRINNGIPDGAFVHSVKQDIKDKNLLFAGTELGVYVSFNGGANWQPLQLNLPNTPVTDLTIKGDDLAASTNGRAFWILDDITPLRQVSEAANSSMHLYAPEQAWRMHYPEGFSHRGPVGLNPPSGAIIDYYFKEEPKGEVTLQILDSSGKVIRTISSREKKKNAQPPEWPDLEPPANLIPAHAGMNRFAWNLRYDSPPPILPVAFYEGLGPQGPIALPGKYTVKLTANGESQTAPLELVMDPRVKVPEADLQQQHELSMQIWNSITQLHEAVNQIRGLRQDLEAAKERLGEQASGKPLVEQIDGLEKKIAPIEEDLVQVNMKSSEGNLSFPNKLDEEFDTLRQFVENADNPPTQGQQKVYHDMNTELQQDLANWKEIADTDVPALNSAIEKSQVPAISVHPLTE
jgi:photosystem II stability/assembly factor-like uncharacterized protein